MGGLDACRDTAPTMDTIPFVSIPTTGATMASVRSVYLQRLERLRRLRHQHEQELNRQGIRLLDRSAFAAYCACREVGAEDEAREILREVEDASRQLDASEATLRDRLGPSAPDKDAA